MTTKTSAIIMKGNQVPDKGDILDLSYRDLVRYLEEKGESSFRATQLFAWVYQRDVRSFSEMKNLPGGLRAQLAKDFILKEHLLVKKEISKDGTEKFLFFLADGEQIETVLIPSATRTTVCVSTQAGCKFGCKFCASGRNGWKRDLSTAEIVNQVLYVKEETRQQQRPLSHVVYMGMGEPLDNFQNLQKSIYIINDKRGINIGARRITVSTCGIIPGILELGKEGLQVELSISLHGYDNESRNILMPVNKKYPFDELIQACQEYQKNYRRQITFEYILIKDVTCSERAARAIQKAVKGLICKLNLIPYNPIAALGYQTPSRQEILAFKKHLQNSGIHATIRVQRGADINSACGQLRSHFLARRAPRNDEGH